jgi:hypothetical protein
MESAGLAGLAVQLAAERAGEAWCLPDRCRVRQGKGAGIVSRRHDVIESAQSGVNEGEDQFRIACSRVCSSF